MDKQEPKTDWREEHFSIDAGNFILLVLSCLAAPLISHLCDLVFSPEENELTSEKLLCAYFLIISLDVIYGNIVRALKKTKAWKSFLYLGDSDVVLFAVYIVGISIVLGYYDTLPGAIAITVILVIAFILLAKRPDTFKIDAVRLILYALISAILVPTIMLNVYGRDWRTSVIALLSILVVAIAGRLLFTGSAYLVKKVAKFWK